MALDRQEKLKILQITHAYLPEANGMAEVVSRLSEGLVRRGHEVHVATSYCPERRDAVINGVRVWPFRIAGNWMRGCSAPRGEIERFRDFVRQGNWDVQANHHNEIWCIDLLLDLLPALPWAKVYTPHGLWHWKVPEWEPYYRMMPGVFRNFDAITCLSETFDEKPFCDAHGIKHAYVIPNGVDPAEFDRPPLGLRQSWGIGGRPFVLNVSNHAPLKGHRFLFQLSRGLPKDSIVVNIGNSYRAEKWGVGRFGVRGGCFYKCRFRSLFRSDLQLRQHVPRPAIASALREANVYVHPSTREASSLVILEAMAAGLPWVAFDAGNVREHTGGIVVQSLDEMAAATAKLLGDSDLRSRLGAVGRERIQARHLWEKIIDSYEELYYQVWRSKQMAQVS